MAKREHRWLRRLRRLFGLGLVAGTAYAVLRALEERDRDERGTEWEPQPFPFPPQPRRPDDSRPGA